jgi:hypothetical protein
MEDPPWCVAEVVEMTVVAEVAASAPGQSGRNCQYQSENRNREQTSEALHDTSTFLRGQIGVLMASANCDKPAMFVGRRGTQ